MIFETHAPPERFAGLIESIFHYKGYQPDHAVERVVPTGHVFLLFELDGFERQTFDPKTLQPSATFSKAWVSGIHSNHLSISAHPDSEMLVVQFKAFGAYPFLQTSMLDLADRVIPGACFAGSDLLSVREQMQEVDSSADKFDVADTWLTSHFDARLVPPASLVDVVKKVQSEPTIKLKQVIDAFDGTQKHLISQFKKYIGITPKQYQRVIRFNSVFTQMQNNPKLKWSDIAYMCGYSDQSHFIREFKNFSGFIPESFLRENMGDDRENFFPLDRNDP